MRITRAVALGVVAWLAVVALGSTVVWAVISRVGDDVTSTTSTPAATATSDRTSTPATTEPDPTATPRPDGSEAPEPVARRTWQGVGGSLVASCRGAVVSLVTASPDTGYAYELEEDGPDVVAVEFEGRDDDEGRKVMVEAVCVEGVPEFTVETDD